MGNIMLCTISPSNYSQYDLDNRIPFRSITTVTPNDLDIRRSSASFSEVPISSKLTYIINVDANNKVQYNQRIEFRLTRNATVMLNLTTLIKYEEVHDVSASLDGQSLTLEIIEINGTKYYAIPKFNLTNINEVRTVNMLFTEDYNPVSAAGGVKTPWIFNENYAKIKGFTLPTIPIEKGGKSDICELRIDFNLPYMKVLLEQSGWFDAFINSQTGLKYNNQNQPNVALCFEYPIEQTITKGDNPYTFQAYFSEQNQSNQPTLTVMPDFIGAPLLLISFLASPFLVMLGWWLDGKRSKGSSESQSKTEGFLSSLIKILKSPYTLPLAIASFISLTTYPTALNFFSFIYEITNLIVLIIIILFPAIFYFIYAQFKKPL